MAMNNTTIGATAFLASLFCVSRSPVARQENNNDDDNIEINDWELVNNSDLSDEDDDVIDIASDSESERTSTLVSLSFVSTDRSVEKDDLDFDSVAVVAYGIGLNEQTKISVDEDLEEEEVSYIESDEEDVNEEDDDDDLDDELVPWSVGDRFGRQRMRKLGTRVFAKMNKTTKKFSYTVNRPGCVHGKHGLGRKG